MKKRQSLRAYCLAAALVLSGLSGCGGTAGEKKPDAPVKKETDKNAEPEAEPVLTVTAAPAPTVTPTAIPTPTVIPEPTAVPAPTTVPEPTSTPVPQEEGMLKKPDHPDAVTNDKLIFIGDSRTVDIRDAVNDDSIWSCKSAMGYEWMSSTGVPQIEDEIDEYTAVIILMGVNDVHQINDYVNYINAKAAQWSDLGAGTYFVSVGPVENDPYVTNREIESFNASMKANLAGVTYIDIYSHLVNNGFCTVDGTHYPDGVSVEIYNYILDHLEETRSGLWG